jgi:hypothetical protein
MASETSAAVLACRLILKIEATVFVRGAMLTILNWRLFEELYGFFFSAASTAFLNSATASIFGDLSASFAV